MTDQPPAASRRLSTRLALTFIGFAITTWALLVAWGIYTVLTAGKQELRSDLSEYARQVLAVTQQFANQPTQLSQALALVETIENESENDSPDPHPVHIQVWIDGAPLRQNSRFSNKRPDTDGLHRFVHDGEEYIAIVAHSDDGRQSAQLTLPAKNVATISTNQAFFLFLPLVFSLPVLLLPAWLMTRFGLRPLGEVVARLRQRTESGDLSPMPASAYKELNPIVYASNQLMARLDDQLRRERAFVADVAHELKTPMSVIQTNAGILASSTDAERRKRALNDLVAGVSRSDHLVEQLLHIARLEQGELDRSAEHNIDLAEFIRERIALFEPIARKREQPLRLIAPKCCPVVIDVNALSAVLDNALDNAIKYSPDGMPIDVELLMDPKQAHTTITVRDYGPGLVKHERELVFERFQRGSAAYHQKNSGSGLGLTIARRAARRLGGSFELLEPPVGPGLIARLSLPPAVGRTD